MSKISSVILSYEITKGMKSFGPIGLLKSKANGKELILCQIEGIEKIFKNTDIFVVSGFGYEKLNKIIPKDTQIILNNEFQNKSHGYAIKLILAQHDLDKYDGVFIINNGVIIKAQTFSKKLSFNHSWVLSKNIKTNQQNSKFLGSVTNEEGLMEYIFYNVGQHSWCEGVYFCNKDIKKILSSIDSYYDNMFLFEIINKSILQNIKYQQIVLGSDEVISIYGMKDKHKIKV